MLDYKVDRRAQVELKSVGYSARAFTAFPLLFTANINSNECKPLHVGGAADHAGHAVDGGGRAVLLQLHIARGRRLALVTRSLSQSELELLRRHSIVEVPSGGISRRRS